MMRVNPLQIMHITSRYGPRPRHPVTGKPGFHKGIDLRAPIGTPVRAVADGRVIISKTNNGGAHAGLGHYIIVEHDGFCFLASHLRALGVPVGTRVKAGDIIAYSGNTGISSGPHVHMELRLGKYDHRFWLRGADGNYLNGIDPTPYIVSDLPAYEQYIRLSMAAPHEWVDRINRLIAEGRDPHDQWLPLFIEKLAKLKV